MKNKDIPLVSVVILSFNRRTDLEYTLQKVYEQDYPNFEVIVVDNKSEDGSAEMVKKKYPQVTLILLSENIGIAGWNEGVKVSKGMYVLFLDDDSYPAPGTLTQILSTWNESTILALDIRYTDGEYYAPYMSQPHMYPTFIGCGVIIPRSLFVALHGYEPLLFLYAHEEDFVMRALQSGYKIQYIPQAIVYHVCSKNNRIMTRGKRDRRKQYYQHRNIIILFLFHFPLLKIAPRVFRFIAGRLLFSLVHSSFIPTCRGIWNGIMIAVRNWEKRMILHDDIQRLYGNGKYLGSFFADGNFGFKRPGWL
jgi:GT2 family glycosyltransferase